VVREQGPTVMRVCRALLDPADAEDAWSETFVAAMQAYPRLRPDSNIRGWLVTIAHRKAIDLLRRTARAGHGSGDPVEVAAEERNPIDRDDELRAAVEALPFKQRWAVIYRHPPICPTPTSAPCSNAAAAARRNTADGIAKLRAQMKGEGR
jgi:RNA polymerase sigma factor (sigma-70 family)